LSVFLVWLISARAGSDQQSELLATPGGVYPKVGMSG
jgi:hypothetical protein